MIKSRHLLVFLTFLWCFSWFQVVQLTAEAQEIPPKAMVNRRFRAPKSNVAVGGRVAADYAMLAKSLKPGRLSSPTVAQKFYEIGYELANSEDFDLSRLEQAVVFLTASLNLDSDAGPSRRLLIKLACRHPQCDYTKLVHSLLIAYVSEFADLDAVREGVMYLMERLNSREQREQLLQQMLQTLSDRNAVFDSELATLLGLLEMEKADYKSAESHLIYAYRRNKYNKLAFTKLTELIPEEIDPPGYLEHLRLLLREDPLDVNAALSFANYAEGLQMYATAAGAYEYSARLSGYLYPSQALPRDIYLPWLISAYNSPQGQDRCLEIAKMVRQGGRFDLLAEAIAGKAAAKMGERQARQILRSAAQKARQLPASERNFEELAWFYCFALPEPNEALHWANKAYSAQGNRPAAAAILAYSLVMNQQIELAEKLIVRCREHQIAKLALALIQLKEGKTDSAIETLEQAVAKDPGSLAAEKAKELLAQQGKKYIWSAYPDFVLATLSRRFGQRVVPVFVPADRIISYQLHTHGRRFSYGSKFGGTILITNNSAEPLVISDAGFLRGHIRIDAVIRGDLHKKISNLVSRKLCTSLVIKPGRSIVVPLSLAAGELRRILLAHPRASLEIEFTAYLDPVTGADGTVANRLATLRPIKLVVNRPGVRLSTEYLRNRLNTIFSGSGAQKTKTAQLFVGLLKEQARGQREFEILLPKAVAAVLKSALVGRSGLLRKAGPDEWEVRVHTMAEMISLPLDDEMTEAVKENLNHARWPVRMMALYLLAQHGHNKSDLTDQVALRDSNELVRAMAIALGATSPGR